MVKVNTLHQEIIKMFNALSMLGMSKNIVYELTIKRRFSDMSQSIVSEYRLCYIRTDKKTSKAYRYYFDGYSGGDCLNTIIKEIDNLEKNKNLTDKTRYINEDYVSSYQVAKQDMIEEGFIKERKNKK